MKATVADSPHFGHNKKAANGRQILTNQSKSYHTAVLVRVETS